MGTIGYLVSTGVIAWVALAVLVFEFLIVVAVSRGRAGLLLPMAANALFDACLILAFHAALTAAGTLTKTIAQRTTAVEITPGSFTVWWLAELLFAFSIQRGFEPPQAVTFRRICEICVICR